MEQNNLIAKAEVIINASADKVWNALTNPAIIKKYMFGTTVTSNWTEGSKITWEGEWKGKTYTDQGVILKVIPKEKLQYSHYSPLAGLDDKAENYHTVTIIIKEIDSQTQITLFQDKNLNEEAREHAQKNWEMMLTQLKKVVETPNN